MQSLNYLLQSGAKKVTQKHLQVKLDRVRRGYETGLNICCGTAFRFKDFELKIDPEKEQWSSSCSFWVGKSQVRCANCNEFLQTNLSILKLKYDEIEDLSKITFNAGVIDVRGAVKKTETKEKAKETVKKDSSDESSEYVYSSPYDMKMSDYLNFKISNKYH